MEPSESSSGKKNIFNDDWELVEKLGEGHTSKVYKVRHSQTGELAALKMLKDEFLSKDKGALTAVENEIQILQALNHPNVVKILGQGTEGHVLKKKGKVVNGIVYLLLECITGGLLFDVAQTMGGMGEDAGRFFMSQMLDVLEFMHGKGVAHRDLKLENIMVDENMNLKVADFGYSSFTNVHKLKSYRGTKTYMAPEIKYGKVYDGFQIDMFSTGVILFILVHGTFPFKEAKKDEYYYNMIYTNKIDEYFDATGANDRSSEFKDLILSLFSYNGEDRMTVEQVRNHAWMQKSVDHEKIREELCKEYFKDSVQSIQTGSTRDDQNLRGDGLQEMIRLVGTEDLMLKKFNNQEEFDTDVAPGLVYESIQDFSNDLSEVNLQVSLIEKEGVTRSIKITIPDDS